MIAEVPLSGIRVIPTPNSRLHWRRRAVYTKEIRTTTALVVRSAMNATGTPKATGYRRLSMTLVRGPGQKMLDHDNAVAGLKPAVDGLVDAGLISGDRLADVMITYSQERGPEPLVRVEYVPD